MNLVLQKILAAAATALAGYLAQKLGSTELAAGVVGAATALVAHYFHVQPAPVTADNIGNP